ncbi:rho guanine nucleotide exchange factor 11 isoform X3 [Syngnathus acus]|uniref:rho guanine nucleotide exchange factor 11 isoform X3 n=1 Tax=Syngnathus acus TaxID=161584 RepID=UPI001885B3E9|nr:rho guanine nucleotide exchange factor 11 isoform X3 [Syngnathus acus]
MLGRSSVVLVRMKVALLLLLLLFSTSNLEVTSSPTGPDDFLGPEECLARKPTRASCDLVFCPPWERCINGQCSCKPPYLCPADDVTPVCGRDGRLYRSFCQAMALSCRSGKSAMSHFGKACSEEQLKFRSFREPSTGVLSLFVPDEQSPDGGKRLLVCGQGWDMASANVMCKDLGHPLGAASAASVVSGPPSQDLGHFPERCVSVRCRGFETSLAECVIHDSVPVGDGNVATATCYGGTDVPKVCDFACANGKCVSGNRTCDGIDDCGDRSDEMCCKRCRSGAFRCETGVCVHADALADGQMDCLAGEDEAATHEPARKELKSTEYVSPRKETRVGRIQLESKLQCGVPNVTAANDDSVKDRVVRVKRVVGGIMANRTQIQWQVGLEENGRINCGGTYIGGCWVITAAHCVRPSPWAYRIRFSIWKRYTPQDTTDIIPVGDVIIHPRYNVSTYQNDIALVRLKDLPQTPGKCMEDNPAVKAACVPWSTRIFNANHTCSISGWGRTDLGKASQVLQWANVSLIPDCQRFYKDRFKPGMMCAGDLDGNVDSCQGDSGGPLVCEDHLGVSYLWGIVSWGDQCGHSDSPGVYTQVIQIRRIYPCVCVCACVCVCCQSGRTQIIGPEEEDEDGYAFNEMDGPFQDVELLKLRPAHMTVFLRYVFTQLLDPNPLLFYLSVEAYLSAAPKDARSLAPQICAHFLDPDAPLKLKVPVDYLTDIESRFHAQEDIRGPLSELQQQVLPHIQDQLLDYRNKQMMGLGALFGEADLLLLDGDPMKERQVVDKQVTALWEILCKHEEDRSSPLASAVLLYLRHAGIKLRDSKAFLGLSSEKEKWMAFLKAKKPGSAKKEKDGEDKKRNPLLKYIGKPRSTSQSMRPGSVKNIIQHFENHTEDGGGDPSSPSSGVDEDSPSGSKRLARSESLKAQGEGRRRGGASCGDSVPRSRSDVDMEDPAAEDREGTAFRLQHSTSSASGSSARSLENATPPYTPRSIRRGTESPLSLLLLDAGGGGEEEACEGQNWQETVPRQLLDTLSPREVERQAVIYELFTTEASHLRTLRVLDQVFLQKMRSVLNADELACIFPNLPQVYELHASLCEAMRKRRESLIVQDIGDVMLARFEGAAGEEFEEQASRLCMQQSRALELIKSKQRKDPRFAHIVQECEASRHCRRLQLRDLLVAEMQRLTKYPLLLDNIIKHSEVTSADLPALRRAQACCRGILQAVNEVVRETQHRHHLSKYQRRLDVAPQFKGLDLSTKKMIHEGPLLWKVSKDKQLDIHALLLSDCLLLLQRGPDERLLLRHPSRWLGGGSGGGSGGDSPLVNLDSLLVRSVATDNKALYVISTAESQIYELVAGTASEKNTWKDFLEKTIASAASPPVSNHGSAAETLGGASLVEAAGPTHTENAAKTLVDADAISAARDQSEALHCDDGHGEGVAQAALQDVETLRQLLVLSAHADVWSHAFPSSPNQCVHNLSQDQWEAAPCSSAQLRPKAAVADDATTASEQLSPSRAAAHGNVFYLAMPAGESTTDPTDGGLESDPSAGQWKASWQSHMIKNVEEVFRTIEDLTSKLRRLKDMEGEHRKLLTSLRESRREEEDRGSADGKEANPAQPSIQSTGL